MPKTFVQGHHRQEFAAHLDQALDAGDAADHAALDLQRFDHVAQRDDVGFLAGGDRHAVEDGQGQRQAHRHAGADAAHGFDLDAAAHGADVALDHVHADAAAGDLGDLLGGGEAGFEDQQPDFGVAHLVVDVEAAFARLGQDAARDRGRRRRRPPR
jgi:hypothetical protein